MALQPVFGSLDQARVVSYYQELLFSGVSKSY